MNKNNQNTEDDFVEELIKDMNESMLYYEGITMENVVDLRDIFKKHKHHLKAQFESLLGEEREYKSCMKRSPQQLLNREAKGWNEHRQQALNKLKEL